MARRGNKKAKSNHNDAKRVINKIKRLAKHLSNNPGDQDASNALKSTK